MPIARMKSADRKVLILEAAVQEYGLHGLHETSTERIADRAGVSQPYLFRLFGTKSGLICAAIEQHAARMSAMFRDAVEHRGPDVSPLDAMAAAYLGLVAEDATTLRCQLHIWAAASDPDIHDVARRTFREVWTAVTELSGGTAAEVREFMGQGMLLTILGSLDLTSLFSDPLQLIEQLH